MKYMKIPTFRVIIIQVPALALSIEGLELMAIWAAFASGIQLHGELRQIVFLACIYERKEPLPAQLAPLAVQLARGMSEYCAKLTHPVVCAFAGL